MSKVKMFYKIQTIILFAVIASLVVCLTVGTAFADTEFPILNLENCNEQLEDGDLAGYAGIVTDLDCVKNNKVIFSNYIESSKGRCSNRFNNWRRNYYGG